ncbi:MAG: serpin family protein [Myxococcales bacterium]|nr:serpin family protein [Myxococcales bacterium]
MRSSILTSLLSLSLFALACDEPARPDAQSPSNSTTAAPQQSSTSATPATSASSSPAASTKPTASAAPVDPPPVDAVTKLAQGSNAFGFDLYKRLQKDPGNIVISPASITTALAMTWGGAKGETAEQMKKVLHFDGSADDVMSTAGKLALSLESPNRPVTFRIANQLFGEKTFKFEQPFLDKTKAAYGAPLELLDFVAGPEAARGKINGWVEQETEKRITDLIPKEGITGDTRLVLVNAIYFLGDWENPFEKDRTQAAAFSTTKADKVQVPTMNQTAFYKYAKKDGVQALEIPYKGGSMSMVIVLPDAVDGLGALEKSFDAKKLDDLAKSMKGEQVFAQIPKFEIAPQSSLSLGDHLVEMGMKTAFDRKKADFTLIANPPSPDDRLYIGKVFHKGFIKVDEKGTEAAAATAVAMPRAGSAAPAKPTEFKADHPFLYVIRDNASGLVLFMGRVSDPTKK